MTELSVAIAWLRARIDLATNTTTPRHGPRRYGPGASRVRDERGATAVEWLLIIIGAVTICGLAIAAVTTYVNTQSGKLNK